MALAGIGIGLCGCNPSATPPSVAAALARADGGPAPLRPESLPPLNGRTVHFTELRRFAPDALLEFAGGRTSASTAHLGAVAVSEVERQYHGPDEQSLKLRLLDTSLDRGAAPAPGKAFEDAQRVGRPIRTAGAAGYVEYGKESHLGVANLIVADRVLVTLTLQNASGPEDAERLAAALDLAALDRLVRGTAQ